MTEPRPEPAGDRVSLQYRPRSIWYVVLFALFVRMLFAFVTPAWQSADEYPHFWYAQELSRTLRFPAVSSTFPGYEAFQPPLYYGIAAALLRISPAGPPFSLDVIEPPTGALLVLRFLSVAFGVLATWLTYLAARAIPAMPERARIVAALFTAALPTYVGTTSSVNNDGLAVLLGTACIASMLRFDARPRAALLTGFLAGFAYLTKANAIVLLPLIFLWKVMGTRSWKGAAFGCVLATAGWLPGFLLVVLKNLSLTGSAIVLNTQVPFEWNVSIASVVWSLRNLGWSFWLAFGRIYGITPPPVIYLVTAGSLTIAAVIGWWKSWRELRETGIILGAGIVLVVIASLYYTLTHPAGSITSWGKNLYCVLPFFSIGFAFGWEKAFRSGKAISIAGISLMIIGCGWAAYRLTTL